MTETRTTARYLPASTARRIVVNADQGGLESALKVYRTVYGAQNIFELKKRKFARTRSEMRRLKTERAQRMRRR